MCLVTEQSRWRVALKNIKCFKTVNRIGSYYYTPFQGEYIPTKVIDGKRCFRAKEKTNFEKSVSKLGGIVSYSIRAGAIHAYQSWHNVPTGLGNCLYECVIPMGTRYAVGKYGDICAKRIKFVKLVQGKQTSKK